MICEQQYGFKPRKSTTETMFALSMLMNEYREGQTELQCGFLDQETAYDSVPREELLHCLSDSDVGYV